MEFTEAYVKAAKIIATCPRERLPMVRELLLKVGIEITEEEVKLALLTDRDRTPTLARSRTEIDTSSWLPSEDPLVLSLRDAFQRGISLTKVGREVGVHRTTMYRYLKGLAPIKAANRRRLKDAINMFSPILEENAPVDTEEDEWEI